MRYSYLNISGVIKTLVVLAILLLSQIFLSNAQTTYTWNQTGTASWATSTNWTPTRSAPANNDILLFNNGATTEANAIVTQTIGKLIVTNNTTLTLKPATGANATIIISTATSGALSVASASTLKVIGIDAATDRTLTLTTSNTVGLTAEIDGTVYTGLDNAQTTATGSFSKGGASATINFNASSQYQHDQNGGTIPTCNWNATSTLNITGVVAATSLTGSTQDFGNVIYNCPAASGTMSFFTSNTINLGGSLTIQNTNTGKFRCVTSGTLNIAGDITISGGSCDMSNTSGTVNVAGNFTHSSAGTTIISATNGATGTLIVQGNLSLSNGTIDLSSSITAGNVSTLKVAGSFTQSSGTITESGSTTGSFIEFNGTSSQAVTATLSNTINIRVSNPAGISITGTLPLNAGTTFTAAANGTAVTSGTVTYGATTTLIYATTLGAQVCGNEFPSVSGPLNVTFNNTSGTRTITLGGARTVSGTLTLTSGQVIIGNNNLTCTGTFTPGTSGINNMVITNGTGYLIIPKASGTGTSLFPIGENTGTMQYTPISLVFTANSINRLVGARVTDGVHPNINTNTETGTAVDYLSRYWSLYENSSGGTYSYSVNPAVAVAGAEDENGTAANILPIFWNGSVWSPSIGSYNSGNLISALGLTETSAPLINASWTGREGVVYVWNQTGTASWATSSNWTPTRTSPATNDILVIDGSVTANPTLTNVPTQTIGKLVLTNNANVVLNFSGATLTISGGVGTDLDIPVGSTLNFGGTTACRLAFSGSTTVLIGGTLKTSTTNTGTIDFTNSTTIISGTLDLSSATNANTSTTSNLSFSSGAICNMGSNSVVIPIATWHSNSNLNFTGVIGSTGPTASVSNQSFGNVTYNCPSATGTFSMFQGNIVNISTLTIQNTNIGKFKCVTTGTLTIAGNFNITGGTVEIANGSGTVNVTGNFNHSSTGTTNVNSGTAGTSLLNVEGNFSLSNGTFDLAPSATSTHLGSLKVAGSFTQSSGTLTESGVTTASFIEFDGTSSQAVTATLSNTINIRVSNPAGISITGTLPLNAGTTFTAAANGTAVTSGTVTYNTGTTLSYTTTLGAQICGNEFPAASGPVNVTFNNTSGTRTITLGGARTVSGTLTLTSGQVIIGNNNLTCTGTFTPGTSGINNMVITNGTGYLIIPKASGTGTSLFPIGENTGTMQYTPISLVFTANSINRLVGARVTDGVHPNINTNTETGTAVDYLSRYWSLYENSSGGTYSYSVNPAVAVAGAEDENGNINNIVPFYWNGSNWMTSAGTYTGGSLVSATSLTQSTTPILNFVWTGRGDGIVYTWNQTGTASWTTSTNWTPNRVFTSSNDIILFNNGSTTIIATDVPTQTIGKLQVSSGTTATLKAASLADRTLTINTASNDALTISSGSTLVLMGLDEATDRTLTLTTANSSGLIANIDGTLKVSMDNGQATAFGEFNKGGTSATINFKSGSRYEHSTNSNTLPIATWSASSLLLVNGITSSTTFSNSNQTFGNVSWNCTNYASGISFNFFTTTTTGVIAGDLNIQSTGAGTGKFRCVSTGTLTINGNFNITGGSVDIADGSGTVNVIGNFIHSSTGKTNVNNGTAGTSLLNVDGNFSLSNGTFDLAPSATSTHLGSLKVAGSFTQSSGTLTESGATTTSFIEFDGASSQSVTATLGNTINIKVSNPAGIAVTGTLALNNNTTFTAAANGTAVTSGTVTYGTGTTLTYITALGTQTCGNEFPAASSPVNLTINNTSGSNTVSLNGDRTIAGTYTHTAGNFSLGANTFTINGPVSGTPLITGGLTSNLTIGSGTSFSLGSGDLTLNNLTLSRSITMIGDITVGGTLSMSSSVLTASPSSKKVIVLNTSTSAITGTFSSTNYIIAPIEWTFPTNISSDGTSYFFPVGMAGAIFKPIELLNVRTGASRVEPGARITLMTCSGNETFDATLSRIDNSARKWLVEEIGSFESATVRLTETVLTLPLIGFASAISGTYTSVGGNFIGTPTGTITSNPGMIGGYYVLGGSASTYFVNNALTTGDVFTTAIGNNSNAGTAAAPWATLTYALTRIVSGDIINVDAGTYMQTERNLSITLPVSINGAGMDKTIFDNNDDGTTGYFCFEILSSNVKLSSFKIYRYGSQSEQAHCIIVGDGTTTYNNIYINNVQLDDNGRTVGGPRSFIFKANTTSYVTGGGATCNNGWALGGGMTVSGANVNLTIINYSFIGNGINGDGAALIMSNASQNVTIKNSKFDANTNTAGADGNGADIRISAGILRVFDCTFTSSSSRIAAGTNIGGSVEITGGTVAFHNCRFTGHTSAGNCDGTAIGNSGGTLSIDSCYFNSNVGSGADDVQNASGTTTASYCVFSEIGRTGGSFTIVNCGNPTTIGTVTKTNTTAPGYLANPIVPVVTGSCPTITITPTSILPIELAKLNAICFNGSAKLLWQTASELNNDKFIVYHSNDGENFNVIAEIKGAGNSSQERDYSYIHKNPPIGKNYYKLRQIDFDGNYTDSKVVVFDSRCANLNFSAESLYYNGDNNTINVEISSLENENGYLVVYDVSGRNIMNTQFNIKKENETYQFNLPELSRGVYLISLSDEGGGRYTQKIVINR